MLIGRSFGSMLSSFNGPGLGQNPVPGACSADGQFIWAIDPTSNVGFWRRKSATDVCVATTTTGPEVRTGGGGGVSVTDAPPHGPIIVKYNFSDDDASSSAPGAATQSLQVGPFTIPMGARQYTIHWEGALPADWASFITQELAHDCSNCVFSSMIDAGPGTPAGRLHDFFGDALPPRINQDLVTFPEVKLLPTSGGQGVAILEVNLPDQPIAVVKRPDTGEEWGMFMVVMPRDPTFAWDSTTNPYILNFFWRKQPKGVWDWIKRIVGSIVGFVENVICTAMPVAMAAPNPYVMAGAIVLKLTGACTPNCPQGMTYNDAAKICACPMGMTYDAASKTCVPFQPVDEGVPVWAWLLGGAGVLLFLFAGSKPKKTPAAT